MNDHAIRVSHTRPLGALGLLLSLLLGSPTWGQEHPGMNGPPGPGMDMDPRAERMVEEFDLTSEQQERIQAILEKTRQEHERIRRESQTQIDAVLTEEQKAKRTAMMEKRLDRQVEFMSRRLNLTQEQAGKVKEILKEQRNNPEFTRAQVRERISAILTPEQRLEFDKTPKPRSPSERQEPPAGPN